VSEPTEGQVSRRGILTGVAAVSLAGLATAGAPIAKASASTGSSSRRADVIVVGGGAAGCAAAHAVAKRNRSVILLEARGRVGGRTLNHALGPNYPGKITEIGGTFIGPTQDRMYALVKELGLRTFPTYDKGKTTSLIHGKRGHFLNSDPLTFVNIDLVGAPDAIATLLQLDSLSKQVPVGAAWTAERVREFDGQTLETWTKSQMLTERGRHIVDVLSTAVWGCQSRELSLLWALYYIAAAGNATNVGTVERLIGTSGGAQQDRIVGGSQLVWQKIAQHLGRNVVLGAPVHQITQESGGVVVESSKGTFRGKQVIVAMPPALTSRIRFLPDLPPLRDQLVQRFPQGSYAKVEVTYSRPFWRDEGLNGQVFGDNGVVLSWDGSPPDGKPGVMAAFIGGDAAREWDRLGSNARRQKALTALSEYFGPRMLKPLDYAEARWTNDVWSRGGPTGFTPPGVLSGFGPALREPVGRIHWAGTETSDYWAGYMEGAVRSGQRAAREVLAEL
jgi:monoamine oxidase